MMRRFGTLVGITLMAGSAVMIGPQAEAAGPYRDHDCVEWNSHQNRPAWFKEMHSARGQYLNTVRIAEHYRRLDADPSIERAQPCICVGASVPWDEVRSLVPETLRGVDVNLLFNPKRELGRFIRERKFSDDRYKRQAGISCG